MMALNCTGSRLAIVGKYNTMRFIDLPDAGTFTPVAGFERKEVWSIEWDGEKDDTLAIMEKQRMAIIRGIEVSIWAINRAFLNGFLHRPKSQSRTVAAFANSRIWWCAPCCWMMCSRSQAKLANIALWTLKFA